MKTESQNNLFPVFLKLDKLNTLVVGGGKVAAEKLGLLLKSSPNANVTLVTKELSVAVKAITKGSNVRIKIKEADKTDLSGMDIVILATGIPSVNERLEAYAREQNLLINIADTPDHCDFYLGSIVTKGDLKIAISTNGKSPTFAKRFRMLLEDVLPDELPQVIGTLKIIRDRLKGDFAFKVKILNEITSNLI